MIQTATSFRHGLPESRAHGRRCYPASWTPTNPPGADLDARSAGRSPNRRDEASANRLLVERVETIIAEEQQLFWQSQAKGDGPAGTTETV